MPRTILLYQSRKQKLQPGVPYVHSFVSWGHMEYKGSVSGLSVSPWRNINVEFKIKKKLKKNDFWKKQFSIISSHFGHLQVHILSIGQMNNTLICQLSVLENVESINSFQPATFCSFSVYSLTLER